MFSEEGNVSCSQSCPTECEVFSYSPTLSMSAVSLAGFTSSLNLALSLGYVHAMEISYRVTDPQFTATVATLSQLVAAHTAFR